MLYEVEVVAAANSPMDLNRVFDLLGEPTAVTRIVSVNPVGDDVWCDVTGWSEDGPCPAYAVQAEDSGEGVVLLVYGGDDGIRLKPTDGSRDWDVQDAGQWGEPCLMLEAGAPHEVVK